MSEIIRFWNRADNKEQTEEIYGESLVGFLYGTASGRTLAHFVLSGKMLSRIFGMYQSSSFSKHKITAFVKKFGIRMDEYESGPFRSFNDFFIRRFKDGARIFMEKNKFMPAFAEARYLGYKKVSAEQGLPVKGSFISLSALLGSDKATAPFIGGPALVARLCPTDYHRFHYPDTGRTFESYPIGGCLHSVNPLALHHRPDIFATNERQVSILETENFGKVAYIEVGAMCVGKIVQTNSNQTFARGDEKGYFLFGASTVILLGQERSWSPSADILKHTKEGLETFVRLGDQVALAYV